MIKNLPTAEMTDRDLLVKAINGTAEIPLDYVSLDEPAWVEGSRWLQRQKALFRRQKLPQNRYRLMKEILGKGSKKSPAPSRFKIYD